MEIEKEINKLKERVTGIENFIEKEGLSKNGKLVKCKCGYSWISRTKLKLISCPSCGSKIKIE